jgi:tetratricopeptide (TPR) repeat protein
MKGWQRICPLVVFMIVLAVLVGCGSSASDYSEKGWAYFEDEAYDEAIEELNKAIEQDPEFAEAYLMRGLAHDSLNQPVKTFDDFDQAFDLGLDPQSAEEFVRRGRAFEWRKMYEEALADFNSAIALDPEYADAYYWHSWPIYFLDYDIEGIKKDMRKAIELEPENLFFCLETGLVYYHYGEPEEAVEEYERCLELDPNSVDAYEGLSEAYKLLGDESQAEAYARRAKELKADVDNSE